MDTAPTEPLFFPNLGLSRLPRDQTRPMFRRKLGGTEAMYNLYLSHGTEVLSMMSRVESVYPVPESAVRWALECLMARHPLLRSSIKYDIQDRSAVFVENSSLELDFFATERSDWLNVILEEVHKQFHSDKKPLLRCRMLKADSVNIGFTLSDKASVSPPHTQRGAILSESVVESDRYRHKSLFVFIAHHSVIDGGYIMWLFQEFVNFLDAYILQTPIGPIRELPLLPPFEDCLRYPSISDYHPISYCLEKNSCRVKMCYDTPDTSALDDYNTQFKDEIAHLSKNQARNEILFFKFSKSTTSALAHACAREGCKLPDIFMTAFVLAMIDLIYPESSVNDVYEIPFEFMLDFRRHYNIDNLSNELVPYYTGIASSGVPLSIQLKLGQVPVSRNEFLKIANALSTAVHQYTVNPNAFIMDRMKQESEIYTRKSVQELTLQTGKSPFVLCYSNIGRLDNLFHDSLRERIRLTDVHGHSSTLIDQMPIFFVSVMTIKGSFMGNISYCNGYTSPSTASRYMEHVKKYLEQTLLQSVL